ncbi:MAG: thiamine pyrophosphate-dependent enzyme [Clostridia bacterium]
MSDRATTLVWPRPVRDMARQEEAAPRFLGGHSLCAGCGIPMVVRTVLNSIETPVVVVNATGCLEVATTRYPGTAWNVPWLHVAFENAAAVMSGVEAAERALRRRRGAFSDVRPTFVVFAGDGGTYDIGLQSLSGALDRGHRFLYVCYDNEAYMNTGIQRSGATPAGARTSTTPVGAASAGSLRRRKDLTAIVVAHHIPYAAQAAASDFADLSRKARRAAAADGPAFLNVLSSCPLGWGMDAKDSLTVIAEAVESGFWPLYEVVDGRYRMTYEPDPRRPITGWLSTQTRFRHLSETERVRIQADVDRDWNELQEHVRADRPYFVTA